MLVVVVVAGGAGATRPCSGIVIIITITLSIQMLEKKRVMPRALVLNVIDKLIDR